MTIFYSRLSYSLGNEDWLTEKKALQIEPDNRVLCITASGDRPLHLLMHDCKEIISIDANPVQNHLMELKCQALRHLNNETYLSFLGIFPNNSRRKVFQKLAPYLQPESKEFWKDHEKVIQKGVIYQGRTERWVTTMSYFLRFFRQEEIKALFSFRDLEEQRKFLKEKWNHKLWQGAINIAINKWVTKLFLKDPGMYAYMENSISPGIYIYNRMMKSLDRHLACETPLLSFIFLGKVHENALPPYLSHHCLDTIRSRLDKITIKTADVICYLESLPENSLDRLSLSDVASYLDHAHYLRLLRAILRAAKPNARFCLRQLMTRYKIPEGLRPYFIREHALEQKLENEERDFLYQFMVGKIVKPFS